MSNGTPVIAANTSGSKPKIRPVSPASSPGSSVVDAVGDLVGANDGLSEGIRVGAVGAKVGEDVGMSDGAKDGAKVGELVGATDGNLDGDLVGVSVGELVGVADGNLVGALVGALDGDADGVKVGAPVGAVVGAATPVIMRVTAWLITPLPMLSSRVMAKLVSPATTLLITSSSNSVLQSLDVASKFKVSSVQPVSLNRHSTHDKAVDATQSAANAAVNSVPLYLTTVLLSATI